jgi:hypothetical protein
LSTLRGDAVGRPQLLGVPFSRKVALHSPTLPVDGSLADPQPGPVIAGIGTHARSHVPLPAPSTETQF